MFHNSINLSDPRTGYGIVQLHDEPTLADRYGADRNGPDDSGADYNGTDRNWADRTLADRSPADWAQADTAWPDVDPGYPPAIGRDPLVPSFSTAELREIVMQILG